MYYSLIAAVADNNGIGKTNKLLWHISADLKYFKKTTSGHPVIMGRKTFESIGKALPGRTNIILTRNKNYTAPSDCIVCNSLEKCNELLTSKITNEEVFIIGGSQIYKTFFPISQKLYITHVHTSPDADTFFPQIDSKNWEVISKNTYKKNQEICYNLDFVIYKRKR